VRLLREDIRRSKRTLEDITGAQVKGYRAPTFSISRDNRWAYDLLEQEGYRYSSSTYPIRHDLYGDIAASREPFQPGPGEIWEIPLTTRRVFGQNIPSAGGGYFRLLPYSLWRRNLLYLTKVTELPCIFYFHPWELDAAQPRIAGISMRTRLRHYTNLRAMPHRLHRLLRDFRWAPMDQVFGRLINGPDAKQIVIPGQMIA
jgi:polysaccharide deacetylase family protein (PEP-CTERM system associated)